MQGAGKRRRTPAGKPARERSAGRARDEGEGFSVPPRLISHMTQALRAVLRFEGPADAVLSACFRKNHDLGVRDRGFIAETVYFALRRLGTIAWAMHPADPARSPHLAALFAVSLAYGRDAAGGRDEALDALLEKDLAAAPPEVRSELPGWLYARLVRQYPDHEGFIRAMRGPAPLDVRVNIMKATREAVLRELRDAGAQALPTSYSPDGVRFVDKPGITGWPVYREGRVEVQDEGSQLIARLVAPKRREMVCDFCAGAGGKTLALGALMRSTGSLYAFDVNAKRLSGMVPRLRRAGLSNVRTIAIRDERDRRIGRLAGKFDRVLVDAPCTGTGTLRRNPDLKWRLSEKELHRVNAVQASVLREASKLVKAGGRLVYATCSILEEENQAVVEAFLAERRDFRLVPASGVLESQGVFFTKEEKEQMGPWFAMLPQRHGTDGFFAAVMERVPDKA